MQSLTAQENKQLFFYYFYRSFNNQSHFFTNHLHNLQASAKHRAAALKMGLQNAMPRFAKSG